MTLKDVPTLFRTVRNPVPLIQDRLGLARTPYTVRTAEGLRVALRPGTSDRYIFFETLVQRVHVSRGQTIRRGDTVVDIGANIGCFSVLAAHLAGPSGLVLAVEPEESNFRQLQRNIALNRFSNVIPIRAAVAGSGGRVTLRVGAKASFNTILNEVDGRQSGESHQQVTSVSLQQVLDEHRVSRCSFLKMDCEGAEYPIFDTMTTEVAARLDQVSLETHSVPGRSIEELVDRLSGWGFRVQSDVAVVFASRVGTGSRDFSQ